MKLTFDEKQTLVTDLYERKAKAVKFLCMRYVKEHEAEELVNDIFVNVITGLDKFNEKSKIETWLYRITVNTCLNKVRYKQQNKREAYIISIDEIFENLNGQRDIGSQIYLWKYLEDKKNISVLEDISSRQMFGILHTKIEELPDKYRDCLRVFISHGSFDSYEEVAKTLGIPQNTVRSRLARARTQLKRKMKKYMAPSSNG